MRPTSLPHSTQRLALIAIVGGALFSAPREARAELPSQVSPLETQADGVYGRFSGDLDLGLGAGLRLSNAPAQLATRLSFHYFSMAGVSLSYADNLASSRGNRHSFAAGIDLRPLFLPRWSLDLERGPAILDLTVDSVSLGLGAYWAAPAKEAFGWARGLEISLGVGVPLFGHAEGLWLDFRGAWLIPDEVTRDPAATLTFALAWHELLRTPLAKRAP
ncbi:MAG: hypothetical protein RJA70_2530 [Pseudomonadota bacterium]|jgi:hypothetical protein